MWSRWGLRMIAAVVIGFLNATLGFALKVITFPLAIVTFGLFLFGDQRRNDHVGVKVRGRIRCDRMDSRLLGIGGAVPARHDHSCVCEGIESRFARLSSISLLGEFLGLIYAALLSRPLKCVRISLGICMSRLRRDCSRDGFRIGPAQSLRRPHRSGVRESPRSACNMRDRNGSRFLNWLNA